MVNQKKFERVLPRLVASYDSGTLVPFCGAGTSAPNCALWNDFIANLETEAGLRTPGLAVAASDKTPASLIRRAGRAVRKLKYQSSPSSSFSDSVFKATWNGAKSFSEKSPGKCPKGAASLAEIWWPLVITTNYDDWFLTQWNKLPSRSKYGDWEKMQVVGRSDSDCERVMNAVRAPDNPLLWALQGFRSGFHPDHENLSAERVRQLESELVVGHEEYRSVAHRSPGFRRAFSEIFRSRSLLFYGSGLEESYFINLFDEVLELQGSLHFGHYAFIEQGCVDVRFLRERYQIEVIEYDDHDQGYDWLKQLKESIQASRARAASWGVSFDGSINKYSAVRGFDLQVIRQKLPSPGPGECLLLSAGVVQNAGKDVPFLSSFGLSAIEDNFKVSRGDLASLLEEYPGLPRIWRLKGLPIFIAAARKKSPKGHDYRDARVIFEATQSALREAERAGFTKMNATLLASGNGRAFPSHVSLIQMVRAYAQSSRKVQLVLSVPDDWCVHLLASGRLNLAEIAASEIVKFWVELTRPGGTLLRYLECASPQELLGEILDKYDLDGYDWEALVVPSPVRQQKKIDGAEIMDRRATGGTWTVDSAGLFPGSTLKIFFGK